MNRLQKIAWFLVVTTSSGFILSCIAVAMLYVKFGMPKAIAGIGFMGVAGLGGFSPLIFKKDKGKVTFDERDKQIKKRASLAGFGTFFIFLWVELAIVQFIVGRKGLISVSSVGSMFGIACIGLWTAWAVAILIQYGWGGKGEKS